jgi:serine/threonine protein kinase
MANSELEHLIGQVLKDTYRLEQRLGSGAMGVVFRATHVRIGAPFAVKVLLPSIALDEALFRRFQREAQLAGKLRHPNIIRVVDFDSEGDWHFIVSEYLQGESLDQRLAPNQTLPVEHSVDILAEVCSAMVAAHAHGIVHRDLKPANIMITRDGSVKVLDFGIAKILDARDDSVSVEGEVLGTPDYIAPEQSLAGQRVDTRADVYALGAVAYQLFTGRRPFARATAQQTLIAVVKDEAPTPRALNPALPPSLDEVIRVAMQKDPAERFQSVAAFANALSTIVFKPSAESAIPPTLRISGQAMAEAERAKGELADSAHVEQRGADPPFGFEPSEPRLSQRLTQPHRRNRLAASQTMPPERAQRRACPQCARDVLQAINVVQQQIDQCPSCHGLWFAKDQLGAILGGSKATTSKQFSGALLGRSRLVCPDCDEPLYRYDVASLSIELEACDQCEGVWLEAGQLARAKRNAKKSPGMADDSQRRAGSQSQPTFLRFLLRVPRS